MRENEGKQGSAKQNQGKIEGTMKEHGRTPKKNNEGTTKEKQTTKKKQQSYKDEIKKNNEKQCGITKGATKEQQKNSKVTTRMV